MGIDSQPGRRRAVAAVLAAVVLVSAGCEPLRKKFVRKKKQEAESTEMAPVLDPVDYPAKVETTDSLYRQQFSLWWVWQTEVVRDFEDKAGDKKIRFDFDKSLASLKEMSRLLQGEPQEALTRSVGQMKNLRAQLDKPEAVRDDESILRKVDSLGRAIKRDFKPEKLSEALIP